MNNIKKHATYTEQIIKLKNKGFSICDEEFCKRILKNIGYYRLSAYFLPFKKTENSNYGKGTPIETVYHIYEFDRRLRNLLFAAIETVEISLKSRLSYFHSKKYGPLGYLDAATFNRKHNSEKFKSNIKREIENNKNVPFVKHHIEYYDGQFPL